MTEIASLVTQAKLLLPTFTEQSGAIIQAYFRQDISVEIKSDQSPVTKADKEVEAILRELIAKHFPEHGIIGEEFPATNPQSDFQWIIDPIDGTKSFIAGFFDFGTIIGLTYKNQPILGAIHQPVLNELFIGDNNVTTLNGKPITTNQQTHLPSAILLSSDLFLDQDVKLDRLRKQVRFSRTWGNCYGYALVAMGLADIMLDPVLALWDKAGLIPVIRGAGGVITNYAGGDPMSGATLIASASPQLHTQVLQAFHL